MSKDTFKTFAKSHPELAKNVMSGKTSWQKLYELYDIYGENSNVWDTYFSKPIEVAQSSIKDMFNNGVTFWHKPSTFLDYSQNNK